jgi:NitT/TauT family transport system ATP-binding protein
MTSLGDALVAPKPIFESTKKVDRLQINDLSFIVDDEENKGKKTILDKVNLEIQDIPDFGELHVLMGPSGCGKSTILRMIAGLPDPMPTSGEVLIDGNPPYGRSLVGMVFQDYATFPWFRVLENVMLPLQAKGISDEEAYQEAMRIIQHVGLQGHEHKFAQKGKLSGGQLQRVAFASGLVRNPSILCLDEPFANLDVKIRPEMGNLLMDLWMKTRCLILMVTHEVTEAVILAQKIHIMSRNPGKIVQTFDIPFSYPRKDELRKDPAFQKLVFEITMAIKEVPQ